MVTKKHRIISIAVSALLVFSTVFFMPLEVNAASFKSTSKIKVSASNVRETYLTIKWNKIKKCYNGYAVFRNGKAIAHLNSRRTSFFDDGLKDGTSYKYVIKTYKVKKQKQYYNKATKKWQKKKPKKKNIGKTRTIKKYSYKQSSNLLLVRTPAIPALKIVTPTTPINCEVWMTGYEHVNGALSPYYDLYEEFTINSISFKKDYFSSSKTFGVIICFSGIVNSTSYSDGKGSCNADYKLLNSLGSVVASGTLISGQVDSGSTFSYEQILASPLSPGTYTLQIEKKKTI